MIAPYVGVCGARTSDEVRAIASLWPKQNPRVLAIGLLVAPDSDQTPRRVRPGSVAGMIGSAKDSLVVLHVQGPPSSARGILEAALLSRRLNAAGSVGVQLNMVWPSPSVVRGLVSDLPVSRIILQVGRRSLRASLDDLATRIQAYGDSITDVLLDPSGGSGTAFGAEEMEHAVAGIVSAGLTLGVGVAGGLDAHTVAGLARVRRMVPQLSFDAEGRLRTDEDRLDLRATDQYLRAVERFDRADVCDA